MADKWVELSDEQIGQLLSEAETRLSTQAQDGKSLSKPSKPSKPYKSDVVQATASKPGTATALKAPQPTISEIKSKEKLSVRVPEVRKGKNEKVYHIPCFPCLFSRSLV